MKHDAADRPHGPRYERAITESMVSEKRQRRGTDHVERWGEVGFRLAEREYSFEQALAAHSVDTPLGDLFAFARQHFAWCQAHHARTGSGAATAFVWARRRHPVGTAFEIIARDAEAILAYVREQDAEQP